MILLLSSDSCALGPPLVRVCSTAPLLHPHKERALMPSTRRLAPFVRVCVCLRVWGVAAGWRLAASFLLARVSSRTSSTPASSRWGSWVQEELLGPSKGAPRNSSRALRFRECPCVLTPRCRAKGVLCNGNPRSRGQHAGPNHGTNLPTALQATPSPSPLGGKDTSCWSPPSSAPCLCADAPPHNPPQPLLSFHRAPFFLLHCEPPPPPLL